MSQLASYEHQTAIFNPEAFTWPVHVIGLGGIGSALILPLAKLGLQSELHLWDHDPIIEPHNIPAQMVYRAKDIGKPKANTAAEIVRDYCDPQCRVIPHAEKVTEKSPLSGVVISGVDSMASRKAIWSAVQFNAKVPLYMDGRMGGEEIALLTLNPSDLDAGTFYTGWLFDDKDGAQLPCAARTVIHPPVVLAGHIIAQLTRFARQLETARYIGVNTKETQLINQKGITHVKATRRPGRPSLPFFGQGRRSRR